MADEQKAVPKNITIQTVSEDPNCQAGYKPPPEIVIRIAPTTPEPPPKTDGQK
jgi:hypothetical protein